VGVPATPQLFFSAIRHGSDRPACLR
jgi:hypothetical protein